MLEKLFKLKENGTNVKTEILAGLTTFMTMAYILVVNPDILSKTGMDFGAIVTATGLSAIVATLVMALWANLPFALAPGMGLNAFFAFTVCLGLGHPWQFALTAVFIEGLIFIVLTFFNVRSAIVNAIPLPLKHAVSCGIGLFIAFIGLVSAGIIKQGQGIPVTLGDVTSMPALIALLGLLVGGILLVRKVKGALLLAIVFSTVAALLLGVAHLPENRVFVTLPPSLEPILFKFTFSHIFTRDMLIIVLTFLFVDMFDTVGTLVGVASKADMLDEKGGVPNVKQALFADAIGTTVGACIGTSTVTVYVESAAGVTEGGRTGLTALVVAVLFGVALFFAPVFQMIPGCATAPVLILVGLFMMSPILKINFDDYTESLPCFLTIVMMPFAYSIAEGISFGIISYVLLKALSGKFKEVSWLMAVLAVLFLIKYAVM